MKQEVMIQIFESDFNNDGLVQTVNARDLHEALGIKRQFANWVKDALQDFEENQDFIIFNANVNKSVRGRPTQDYAITLDTAKHICMMSRCEKGKQLRQYFIEVEKQFRLGYTAPTPQTANTEQQQIINAAIAAINNIAQVAIQAMQSVQVTALPAQQQHTEPVQALPPVGEHHACPANKISLNKMKDYVSNERLLRMLIEGFGLEGELFDPGCVKGTNQAARPYVVYNKSQVMAMLKAAQCLSEKQANGKRKLLGRDFSIRNVIAATSYDSIDFDAACEMIILMKATTC